MKIYWGAGAAVIVYLALAWLTGSVLHLDTTRFWILFSILAVLGISGIAFFVWFQTRKSAAQDGGASGGSEGGDEIDGLIREAERRLAASDLAQGAKLSNLPVVFVIGEPGSTKTSTILHSGLDPELLAGQVYQDNNVVPTRVANFWFARGMVFVEAGGKLLSDPGRWTQLLRRLQPRKLKSVIGAGAQAPRAALLCLDAETFTQAGDALSQSARLLQIRLGEISQQFGISFPVYVVFTRMNRIAFFEDFVRNFSNEEAAQAMGATLAQRSRASTGVYAEEETQRLTTAFESIFHSLADHRTTFLPRENDPQKLPGAYEFPREFRKLRPQLVQFLVDVCRPSQLRASPFLRGFYFSGVRPIVVHESAAPEAPRAEQRTAFEAASSATGIFKAGLRRRPRLNPCRARA